MRANIGLCKARCREHIQAIRTNKQTSKYAQHIPDTRHTYNTIKETLEVLHIKKKGQFLNTLERFHIYDLSRQKIQMNDTFADIHNKKNQISFCIVISSGSRDSSVGIATGYGLDD
jgi:hypothetical protein